MEVNFQHDNDLSHYLEDVHHQVVALLVNKIKIGNYQTLLSKARVGIGVDLVFFDSQLEQMGLTNHFLTNFRKAGGRVFLLDEDKVNWRSLKISRQNYWLIDDSISLRSAPAKAKEQIEQLVGKQIELVAHAVKQLLQMSVLTIYSANDHQSLLGNTNDEWNGNTWVKTTEIQFTASAEVVNPGKSIELQWNVPEAEHVSIYPLNGLFPSRGSKTVILKKETEFVLTAHCKTKSIAKVISVALADRPALRYFLTKTNSLGEEPLKDAADLPHYFGLVAGELATLHWDSFNSKEVHVFLDGREITPQENSMLKGQLKLQLTGRHEIRLLAIGRLEQIEQLIVIKVFEVQEPDTTQYKAAKVDHTLFSTLTKWLK